MPRWNAPLVIAGVLVLWAGGPGWVLWGRLGRLEGKIGPGGRGDRILTTKISRHYGVIKTSVETDGQNYRSGSAAFPQRPSMPGP